MQRHTFMRNRVSELDRSEMVEKPRTAQPGRRSQKPTGRRSIGSAADDLAAGAGRNRLPDAGRRQVAPSGPRVPRDAGGLAAARVERPRLDRVVDEPNRTVAHQALSPPGCMLDAELDQAAMAVGETRRRRWADKTR